MSNAYFTTHGSDADTVVILDADSIKSGYHGFTSWDWLQLKRKTKCVETCMYLTSVTHSFTHGFFDFGSVYLVDDFNY